mgnify:CR=1 FL=1
MATTKALELAQFGTGLVVDPATGSQTSTGNTILTGELHGPATFVIDPAVHGNNSGTVQIKGDLQVLGNTVTLSSSTMTVADLNITVAQGAANAAAANGAGMTVDGAGATFTYSSSGDKWNMNKSLDTDLIGNVTGNVTGTVSDISNFTTANLTEHSSKLYYTNARANTAIDTRVNKSFVDNLNVDADTLDGLDSTGFDAAGTALALAIALG